MKTTITVTGGEGENANTIIVVHPMPDTRSRQEQSTPREGTYGPVETKSETDDEMLQRLQSKAWEEGAGAVLAQLGYSKSAYRFIPQANNLYREQKQ
ncbi:MULTISPECIES: hypothetical protein [Bifidobacterium]|uniref:Uncharacterized protein n=1 Tax=Bifidobacterium tibiigranuli TaxID=2172043 RepID=A0A5N6S8S3_9BIFI|nr:hypothetical protein [Bifidobacterium tibiigranuli]KAE8130234.1 hypothetical protein DDE84_01250 [Bifidobacterium tibiigranuli]KAE8130407.1 hypothetical protein DDF78_00405 [Bifidobacterium tibiigranuli]